MQRIRPGREDNALCAWVCKLQEKDMSNESLNLAAVAPERFHGLDVFEQLGVYHPYIGQVRPQKVRPVDVPIRLYWISRRDFGAGSLFFGTNVGAGSSGF